MEVDQTWISQEEIDYLAKEFPNLDIEEIKMILECIDIESIKEEFWKENPEMNEQDVNNVVASNAAASYDYHIYNTFNNEAP